MRDNGKEDQDLTYFTAPQSTVIGLEIYAVKKFCFFHDCSPSVKIIIIHEISHYTRVETIRENFNSKNFQSYGGYI